MYMYIVSNIYMWSYICRLSLRERKLAKNCLSMKMMKRVFLWSAGENLDELQYTVITV